MIHVLFPGGAFGTTIEYCIRRFSKELQTPNGGFTAKNNMHKFLKAYHPVTLEQLQLIPKLRDTIPVATPCYPNESNVPIVEIISTFKKFIDKDKVIFVVLPTIEAIERNELFCFHKVGPYRAEFNIKNIKQWNSNYSSFKDLQPWELRELYSLYFNEFWHDTLNAGKYAEKNWLVITPDDLLDNFYLALQRIISHCNLTFDPIGLSEYIDEWKSKQQKIIKEYETITNIIDSIDKSTYFEWETISLMGEAIIQYRLKKKGINIKCYNLNKFPNSTDQLRKYFE